ncbi:MAG: hypothetical protein L3J23_08675, partial [Flavobacteriaceae bacterium]|nr:hypothetical protein [Flavobacteriaceae bacterium]
GRLPYLIKYMPADLDDIYLYTDKSKKEKNNWYWIVVFFKMLVETEAQMIRDKDKDREAYDIVNEELIVMDETPSVAYYIMGGGLIFLGAFISIFLAHEIMVFIVLLSIGLLFFLYAYTSPKKQMILDRKNGLLTFPDWFYMKPHTVDFAKYNKFFWAGTGGTSGALGQQLVTGTPKSARSVWLQTHTPGFSGSWSFMLWYMDKNRPLPPGNAFDPYREKDFERRKAAGFPPPLFKSTYPTPEATPEQNTERRKHWKDEDYYGENTSVWY